MVKISTQKNSKKKVVAIVQARLTSTRLPGKTLINIEGMPLVWHVIDRLRRAKNIDQIVLAIPDTKTNDMLEEFAKANRVDYFRGSEYNLLERHYFAAKQFGGKVIVRIPSDNPILDPAIVDRVIKKHLSSNADYTSTVLQKTLPSGHTEVFNFDTLERVFRSLTDDYEKEHVTPYIYRHPELFKLQEVEIESKLRKPEIKLTVDTEEDMKLMKIIYKNLYRPGKIFHIKDVINFLNKNPRLITRHNNAE